MTEPYEDGASFGLDPLDVARLGQQVDEATQAAAPQMWPEYHDFSLPITQIVIDIARENLEVWSLVRQYRDVAQRQGRELAELRLRLAKADELALRCQVAFWGALTVAAIAAAVLLWWR